MFKKLIAFTCLTLSIGANSATLVVIGGQLTGATGVDVGGTLYDVSFEDGSCNSVFDGCTDFGITTSADAQTASQALLDQVFDGAFNADITSVAGCAFPGECGAFTPYVYGEGGNINDAGFWGVFIYGYWPHLDRTWKNFVGPHEDLADDPESTWANWTVQSVPIPAAAWLFGSALLGLVAVKRQKA